jgi:hypothetical protein
MFIFTKKGLLMMDLLSDLAFSKKKYPYINIENAYGET